MTANASPLDDFAGKCVLFLQSPMGPFFARFGDELEARGATVTRILFNPGDILYARWRRATLFNKPMSEWSRFLEAHLDKHQIDTIFLFANNRFQHREAVRVATVRGIDAFVLEEGYVRPNWLAIERNGVHGHSELPTDPAFYRDVRKQLPEYVEPEALDRPFHFVGWYTTWYSVANTWFSFTFPNYRHHWHMNCWLEAARWFRSARRKRVYRREEHGMLEAVIADDAPPYFFVPLQLQGDYQLLHSPFDTVREFIELIIEAFARDAPKNTSLVLKHHPVDRTYHDYRPLIEAIAAREGVFDRVVYMHDQDLDALLDHAVGTITINSSVGILSIARGVPTICLGKALYAMEGLTSQGTLEEFWHEQPPIDRAVFEGLRRYLARYHHINGGFYCRLGSVPTGLGVRWPPSPPWRDGR